MNKENKKVKICHITSAHNSSDVRIFEKECTSLAKIPEYEVFLVAPGKSYVKNNVTVVGIGEIPKKRIERSGKFALKAYKTALNLDADIYHLHDPELLQFALKLKATGKKVIFDAHEDTVEDIKRKKYIPVMLRSSVGAGFEAFLGKVSSKLDAIISVTPRIVEKYRKYNDNVHLVTNYPIIDNAEPPVSEKSDKETVLCFAGGVSEQWSHEYILDVVNELDNVKYLFFGSGEKSYIDKLKGNKGWSKADYRGRVPFDVVNKELWNGNIGMALCQYVLDADRTGTLGNTKIFEMMLHELPVIATDYTLWKEVVESEKCGICVDPTNVEQIKQAIKTLMEDKVLAKEMGKNGRKAILEKYNWKSQEESLYNTYSSII
jgi:glycosyltransferase involved in cell wall biosynthesis